MARPYLRMGLTPTLVSSGKKTNKLSLGSSIFSTCRFAHHGPRQPSSCTPATASRRRSANQDGHHLARRVVAELRTTRRRHKRSVNEERATPTHSPRIYLLLERLGRHDELVLAHNVPAAPSPVTWSRMETVSSRHSTVHNSRPRIPIDANGSLQGSRERPAPVVQHLDRRLAHAVEPRGFRGELRHCFRLLCLCCFAWKRSIPNCRRFTTGRRSRGASTHFIG